MFYCLYAKHLIEMKKTQKLQKYKKLVLQKKLQTQTHIKQNNDRKINA